MEYIVRHLEFTFLEKEVNSFIKLGKYIPNDYWTTSNYLLDLPKKWCWSRMILKNSKLIGFLIASEKLDSYYINRIVVSPEFKNQGIGALLLDEARKIAIDNGLITIMLKVQKDNKNAIDWYFNRGFIYDYSDKDYKVLKLKI